MDRFVIRRFAHLQAVLAFCLVAVFAVSVARPALAATPAEQFVQENIQRGLTILSNHRIPDSERRSQFRDFLTALTDIRRIALFTLGAERRTATPQQVDAFVDAFRDYAVAVYESRLSQYSGQTLRITGSTERAPGDSIVNTLLVDPNGRANGQEPVQVDFRVLQDNGKFIVIDVSIVGVWLAIEERDQFTAFLQQNNNDISRLIAHLQALTAQLRNGGGQPAGAH